jgi:hypothetical protein
MTNSESNHYKITDDELTYLRKVRFTFEEAQSVSDATLHEHKQAQLKLIAAQGALSSFLDHVYEKYNLPREAKIHQDGILEC